MLSTIFIFNRDFETQGILNPDSEMDLYCLHMVYLPPSTNLFANSSTCGTITIYGRSQVIRRPRSCSILELNSWRELVRKLVNVSLNWIRYKFCIFGINLSNNMWNFDCFRMFRYSSTPLKEMNECLISKIKPTCNSSSCLSIGINIQHSKRCSLVDQYG